MQRLYEICVWLLFFITLAVGLLFLFADPGVNPFRTAKWGYLYSGFVGILGEALARGLFVGTWVALLWAIAFGGKRVHASNKAKQKA